MEDPLAFDGDHFKDILSMSFPTTTLNPGGESEEEGILHGSRFSLNCESDLSYEPVPNCIEVPSESGEKSRLVLSAPPTRGSSGGMIIQVVLEKAQQGYYFDLPPSCSSVLVFFSSCHPFGHFFKDSKCWLNICHDITSDSFKAAFTTRYGSSIPAIALCEMVIDDKGDVYCNRFPELGMYTPRTERMYDRVSKSPTSLFSLSRFSTFLELLFTANAHFVEDDKRMAMAKNASCFYLTFLGKTTHVDNLQESLCAMTSIKDSLCYLVMQTHGARQTFADLHAAYHRRFHTAGHAYLESCLMLSSKTIDARLGGQQWAPQQGTGPTRSSSSSLAPPPAPQTTMLHPPQPLPEPLYTLPSSSTVPSLPPQAQPVLGAFPRFPFGAPPSSSDLPSLLLPPQPILFNPPPQTFFPLSIGLPSSSSAPPLPASLITQCPYFPNECGDRVGKCDYCIMQIFRTQLQNVTPYTGPRCLTCFAWSKHTNCTRCRAAVKTPLKMFIRRWGVHPSMEGLTHTELAQCFRISDEQIASLVREQVSAVKFAISEPRYAQLFGFGINDVFGADVFSVAEDARTQALYTRAEGFEFLRILFLKETFDYKNAPHGKVEPCTDWNCAIYHEYEHCCPKSAIIDPTCPMPRHWTGKEHNCSSCRVLKACKNVPLERFEIEILKTLDEFRGHLGQRPFAPNRHPLPEDEFE